MNLTLQLTPWALGPLLGLLLTIRDASFFWPRRGEPEGPPPFLVFTVVTGLWCLATLMALVLPAPDGKIQVARLSLALGTLAPLAFLFFALGHTEQKKRLRNPLVLLLGLFGVALCAVAVLPTAVTGDVFVVIVTQPGGEHLVLGEAPWYWANLALRVTAVVAATFVLARYYLARTDAVRRVSAVVTAGVLTLVPALPDVVGGGPTFVWPDLSTPAFALAISVLALGLLQHRLQGMGSLARSLVLVELRDPLIVLDRHGRIVDTNRAAENTLGLVPTGEVPPALGTLWASGKGGSGLYPKIPLEVRSEDGEPRRRVFDVTMTPLHGSAGTGGVAMLLRDVTSRDRMEDKLRETTEALTIANIELERLANTDGLTGLSNRRHFMDVLDREVERSLRYGRPLSLIFMDLDHFKSVNDTHGHATGDAVLEAAAHELQEISRDLDVPGRIGGEEFALLLPETDLDSAIRVARRLREQLANVEHRAPDGTTFNVTSSLGVASLREVEEPGEDLLHRADDALYTAKRNGRDQVQVAESLVEEREA